MDARVDGRVLKSRDAARPESLRQKIVKRLRSWPATAAELSDELAVSRESIYGVLVRLDAADRIEMRSKKDQSIRIWSLRAPSVPRRAHACGRRVVA